MVYTKKIISENRINNFQMLFIGWIIYLALPKKKRIIYLAFVSWSKVRASSAFLRIKDKFVYLAFHLTKNLNLC